MADSPMDKGQCTASCGDNYFPEQSGVVPFQWEASPGRPKSQVDLPASIYPLRPPPRLVVETPGSDLARDVHAPRDVVRFQSMRMTAGLNSPMKDDLDARSNSFSHADSSNAAQKCESTGDVRRPRVKSSRAIASLPISELGLTTWGNIDSPRLSYHVRLKLRDLLHSNVREQSAHSRKGSFSDEQDAATLSERTSQLLIEAGARQPLSKNSPQLQLFLRKTEAEELVEALLRSGKKGKDQKLREIEEFAADRKEQASICVFRKLKLSLFCCFSSNSKSTR